LLYIHPVLQAVGFLVFAYALVLGLARFRAKHLHHKARFLWKRHVWAGGIAYGIWMFGFLFGAWAASSRWGSVFVTGLHGKTGLAQFLVVLAAAALGLYMHVNKAARTRLPLIHALLGAAALVFFAIQAVTGYEVLITFVMRY